MKKTPQTPMKMLAIGVLATLTPIGLQALDYELRTDWSGRGNDSNMRNPLNWTKGLPNESTFCLIKKGELTLDSDSASTGDFACAGLAFQQDEDAPASNTSLIIAANLTMGSNLPSRMPNNGNLEVHQTGGEVSAGKDLLLAVKPQSQLEYQLDAGKLTTFKLRAGEGKTIFKQTGGNLEADELIFGNSDTCVVDYTISGGVLKFQKLFLGKRANNATLTISGSAPKIDGNEIEVMANGKLVFLMDEKGVATLGSKDSPLFKAVLGGTLSLKQSGVTPQSAQIVNLIYAGNIESADLKLDPETAAAWKLDKSEAKHITTLSLKAK